MEIVTPNYKSRNNIVLPVSMFQCIEDCNEYELGKVLKMIFIYCMSDKQLTYNYQRMFEFYNADQHVRSVFKAFKPYLDPQIEKYRKMCERNAKNGRKGGRPRKDGTSRFDDTHRYSKREILDEILREAGLIKPKEEPKREPTMASSEHEDVYITPPPTPYYYEAYSSISNASYLDVVNI